jgi:hypothetical protein
MSEALMPARFMAALMLRNAPSPSGDGDVM